jgi:hypothetical protein
MIAGDDICLRVEVSPGRWENICVRSFLDHLHHIYVSDMDIEKTAHGNAWLAALRKTFKLRHMAHDGCFIVGDRLERKSDEEALPRPT